MSGLVIKTQPASEPVTLAEAKNHLRITTTDEDTLIASLIMAARIWCESFTRRAFITQTWTLWLDRFPSSQIHDAPKEGWYEVPVNYYSQVKRSLDIPRPPLQSVTFLQTYDVADVATVYPSSNYLVDTASEPGRIALNFSQSWPLVLRLYNAVQVEFIAGYGTADNVPQAIKQAILMLVGHYFENRESTVEGVVQTSVEQLLLPYRIVGFP